MQTIELETTVETDGEIRFTDVPCRRGDRIKALVVLPEAVIEKGEAARARGRANARERFLQLTHTNAFRSEGPYPSRDELHDRD